MKNKIALRLTGYFSAALLLFSLVIGLVFITMFRQHTITVQKAELQRRAVAIAATLSDYMNTENPASPSMGKRMMSGQGGYGAYLRFLDDIAMTDVWVVDENLQLITAAQIPNHPITYADLPEDASRVVKEVFSGSTNFAESFSGLFNAPTLTVGTPITSDGKVVGALLMHTSIEGMNEASGQGVQILLISLFAALVLSLILSALFALSFTKPLNKMHACAAQLAEGDYSAKTGVRQNDEIGLLAAAIDTLSERLSLAREESARLDALRRDFTANVSHELRTPVTVIRGSLEALCDGVIGDPAQVKSYYRQMLAESRSLERLVNDLLDLSRLQNADFAIEMQAINLCDVLGDAVRSASQMARAKNIEILKETDSLQLSVTGDYGRLRQMFLIVLDNAVKFSPEGSTVTVTLQGRTVRIRDRGPGIAKEDLPYLFDRFYKVKSEDNKTGSGLGLAIAKQIAERHQIGVTVRSTL
jgi:signal transduction histidine kinase